MSDFKYSIGSGETRITFPVKPSEAIRSCLKGAGFRWSPSAGCWWRRGCKGAADFLAALDRRMNPGRPDGACWQCKSPDGFFRREGAATPVRCDKCQAEIDERKRAQEKQIDTSIGASRRLADRFDLDYEDRCREACGL